MADYAIGDVQGCFDALLRLLDAVQFEAERDCLWFVGDLVNRGPQSLEVLRFIKNLPIPARITLGNHDLYFLKALFTPESLGAWDKTLQPLLKAHDRYELGHWLRHQPLLYHNATLNVAMCHAGIAPIWTLAQAKAYAKEVETVLQDDKAFCFFLTYLFGNEPYHWQNDLTGIDRLRLITNYFTRMRFCDEKGGLLLDYSGGPDNAPSFHIPWYAWPKRKSIEPLLLFGHWAALEGKCPIPGLIALDTGCVWGKHLTAVRLQDGCFFRVPGV